MKKQRFCREYVGERLFVLCDDDMEYAAEQQKLPYDMMEAIFESLDKNHAIPKETVTKYGKLLKRIPLWQEAEMAYEVGRLHNGVLKEYYDYRPEAVAVEEAWDEIDGLLDGQLIEVAAEVKRKRKSRGRKRQGNFAIWLFRFCKHILKRRKLQWRLRITQTAVHLQSCCPELTVFPVICLTIYPEQCCCWQVALM
ncbi:MAG: hypothetical protein ACLSEY_13550 [Enterocloster sp.]